MKRTSLCEGCYGFWLLNVERYLSGKRYYYYYYQSEAFLAKTYILQNMVFAAII